MCLGPRAHVSCQRLTIFVSIEEENGGKVRNKVDRRSLGLDVQGFLQLIDCPWWHQCPRPPPPAPSIDCSVALPRHLKTHINRFLSTGADAGARDYWQMWGAGSGCLDQLACSKTSAKATPAPVLIPWYRNPVSINRLPPIFISTDDWVVNVSCSKQVPSTFHV